MLIHNYDIPNSQNADMSHNYETKSETDRLIHNCEMESPNYGTI